MGPAGRPTVFGRNLNYLRRLEVGFTEKFAQALTNPRHTLTRFLSDFDLETISRETGIAGIETGRWLTGLSQVFEWYCHENDLTRTMRVPGGHREFAEFEIIHEEVTPPVRGRRFVLDYEEPQPIIEAALGNLQEGDLEPPASLEMLHIAAVMYIGMEKQPEGLGLIEEMFSLFSEPGVDRFSLPRFFDFMIAALWKTGNRPLAYKAINLSTDIAGEMIIILEMGDPGSSLMKYFSPVPQQLRTIRGYLENENAEEAIRIVTRIDRLLERTETLFERYFFGKVRPERGKLPN